MSRLWTAVAALPLLAACTETVPVEVVLVGIDEGALEDIIVCNDGRQVSEPTSSTDGARFELEEGTHFIEINAKLKDGGWAWGFVRMQDGRSSRLALSKVWEAVDALPPAELMGLGGPRVASLGDGRVVIVGLKEDGSLGAWIWDVLEAEPALDYVFIADEVEAGYSATSLDSERVLIAWSSGSTHMAVLDTSGLYVEEADSCREVLGKGQHGAAAFFQPEGDTPTKVLLAGGGETLGAGEDTAVVFDSAPGEQCTALTMAQRRFAPAVVPYGADKMIVHGGEDEDERPEAAADFQIVSCQNGPCGAPFPPDGSPTQRSGHTASWLRLEHSAWILGGTAGQDGGTTCASPVVRVDAGELPEDLELDGFRRSGHAAVTISELLPEGGEAPSGRILVAGGTACEATEPCEGSPCGQAGPSNDAVVVAVDQDLPPSLEEEWGSCPICLGDSFGEPVAVEVASNEVLVIGDGVFRLVNPGPHPASASPCGKDRSE
ncbi:MAG: hypothetical protein HYY06_14975 [Deltaproteobacteria bacterium]|nr:hypothetical protein [Deltaproteobacteria bacterium]